MKPFRLDIETSYYGGILPILKVLRDRKIPELIDKILGVRVQQAKYSYSDFFMNWITTSFCLGFRLFRIEDMKKEVSIIPGLKLSSHDTLGRMFKKLATPTELIRTVNPKNRKDGIKEYSVNENPLLNDLNVVLLKKMGLLKTNIIYTVDIDATAIESEVQDSKMTYKRFRGFMPMVCMIGKLPVYISMRSGNANPHFQKLDCLIKCLELLKKHSIKVDRVRIDGARYKNEIVDYLQSKGIKFVIGANWSNRAVNIMLKSTNWVKRTYTTSTHCWEAELASSVFSLVKSKNEYRMVVIRIKEDKRKERDQPTKWHYSNGYYYKFVVTNDEFSTPYEIFKEYDQRGTIEKNFDTLKNDFGWRILPFSKLNENLVYVLVTAITNNIYEGVLKIFCGKVEALDLTFKLERFKSVFIKATFFYFFGVPVYFGRSNIPHETLI